MLPQTQSGGAVAFQISFVPNQNIAADARCDSLHCQLQLLKILQNLVGVLNPAVAFARNDNAAIGQATHDEQDRDGRAKCELDGSICRRLGHCTRNRTRSASFEFPQTRTSRVAELTEDGAHAEFMLFPLDILKFRFSRFASGPPRRCSTNRPRAECECRPCDLAGYVPTATLP